MIQNIAPHHFDNVYRNVTPEKDSVILSFSENKVLSQVKDDAVELPLLGELYPERGTSIETMYLFSIDTTGYFLLVNSPVDAKEYTYNPVFQLRELGPRHTIFAILTGFGLYTWYTTHMYCGRCGNKNNIDDKERMMKCPACGNMEYPKISPAVIVAVVDGDKILLSKYAGREYTRYSLLAGFAESGETIEQTVHREIMEEVGLKVKNLRYYKSQPWGLSSSLLLGFFADLDGSPELCIDTTELAEAAWFKREDIPPVSSVRSLTNEMIEHFREL